MVAFDLCKDFKLPTPRAGDAVATQIGISPDCRCRSPLRVLGPQRPLYGRYEDDGRRRTL
jgi:hypothetical protein